MFRTAVLTAALCAILAAPAQAAEPPSKAVDETRALAEDGRLSVDTYKGKVTVWAWDREEVSVRAVVSSDGDCDEAADLVARTRVRVEGRGKEVRVVSDYDDLPKMRFSFPGDCGNRPFVNYEIRMPRGASLEVDDYKSRISVEGVGGPVAIETYKGTVRAKGLRGPLDLETYKGDVVAELDRVSGDLGAETYKGRIELVLPQGARVDLREKVGRRGTLRADVENAPGEPRLTAETYKGTIRVRTR
jgi:hypothetical protein